MTTKTAKLPETFGTVYEYLPATRHGDIIYVAGQIAKLDTDRLYATGRCGEDIDIETASRSAEIAAGQALAWTMDQLGPDEVLARILRIDVYVAVAAGFSGMSEIADAASRTFIEALGDKGRHVRSVIGVERLPRNAPVLIELTASVG